MWQKKQLSKITALTLAIGLIGCGSAPQSNLNGDTTNTNTAVTASDSSVAGERPLVVATTSVLCDLTKQVAVETVNLKCLVGAGQDPHTYQPKPDDRKAIETANLILYGGYNFEPGIIKLVKATSNNAPKVAVHEVAVPKPIMGEEHHHHSHGEEEHDHEHEEEHAQEKVPDPHVWHNAQNGVRMVETIRENLEKVSPTNAQVYAKNAQNLTNEIKQIDSWIKSQITTIPANQRQLVTTHDALSYYTQAYGLEYEGAVEGLSTEAQPTASRVAQLVKEIKKEGVPTIFAESTHNPQLIERVAKEANIKVSNRKLYADGLGEDGTEAQTYQGMLVANTQAIVEGLGGKYTAFSPQ
jgi:manganese/iron transport system substrate-binding protein